jgi:predicted PurR-regulated permease PerM
MRSSYDNSGAASVLLAIAVIGALYLGRVVFIPLALAILFSILLSPVIRLFERAHIPRFLAIVAVVLVLLSGVGFAGWKTSQQLLDLTDQLPDYKKTLDEKIHVLHGMRSESLTRAQSTVKEIEREVVAATPGVTPDEAAGKRTPTLGSSPTHPLAVQVVPPSNPLESLENMVGPLANAFVVAVFTIFILMGREDLRNRILRLAGGTRLNAVTQALDDASHRIDRYLLLQLVVNACYGAVIAIALNLLGIPHASLWGIGAGVLRFLPYLGPPLSALVPIMLSLAVFPGWGHAFATMAVYFCLEVTVANFIEPYLYGAHVGLSPLAILVAAIFWTLIWGFPGLVLSTPITVCLVVMGRYLPGLGWLSILLGDEQTLAPDVEYYQRLLASDQEEARRILTRFRKSHPLEVIYSTVVIPALSLAEQDRHRNELDDQTQEFIYQSTREIVEELGESEPHARIADGIAPVREIAIRERGERTQCDVLCVPSRDEADSLVALVLAQLLEQQGIPCESLDAADDTTLVQQSAALNPKVVFISALPPFAIGGARALYAQLRGKLPHARIVVCFWRYEGDMDRLGQRLRLADGDAVVTNLADAQRCVVEDERAGERVVDDPPHDTGASTAAPELDSSSAPVKS